MQLRTRTARGIGTLLVSALVAGCAGIGPSGGGPDTPSVSTGSPIGEAPTPASAPLAGKVVVLDPGHQLGNRNFTSEINALVDAGGGVEKECNTTGTATESGYPEATFAWQVALNARAALRRLGARVILTRSSNTEEAWGPCVDQRGRTGNPGEPGPTADLRLSLHGDGTLASGARGFHVIRPGDLEGWTDDIEKPSRQLAVVVRDALKGAGVPTSTYAGERGIDVRTDLGTLNHSDVPTVMVELGNMRNADDAALMESAAGRRTYARALAKAVQAFLTR